MFAGLVGVGAIGTVIYASMKSDNELGSGSLTTQLQKIGAKALTPFEPLLINRQTGPRLASGKGDWLMVTSKGLSTRHIIHDTFARKRNNRQYLIIKPYIRIITSLATASPARRTDIPPFDPFRLYANKRRDNKAEDGKTAPPSAGATTRSLELPLSILPMDEQFSLTEEASQKLVSIAAQDYFDPSEDADKDGEKTSTRQSDPDRKQGGRADQEKNTTTIVKQPLVAASVADETEIHEKTVRQGDSLDSMLKSAGAENWQIARITAAMNKIYPAHSLKAGQKLRLLAIPKPGDASRSELVEISLYNGKKHLVTISRNEAGSYQASKTPGRSMTGKRFGSYPQRASLYQSFYEAGLLQHLPPETIMKLLRIHAFDTDFKRATQAGDSFEAFFDTREDREKFETVPNELLYTSVTINGQKRAFYRFRTPDGTIDYYDRQGNSAKKFLMRKPVRSNRIRLASGFGYRIHPILKVRKLHTGTDWAGPPGIPILAAGDGIVEYSGRKGGYGNHIRIRHANGYKTTYSHMSRFARDMAVGLKVRQGQVIGYVGNTGRSTGPHLHFEVLVNNRFVNAMTIPVPRGMELKGHLLTKFFKERDRIDELMSRDPVRTKIASAKTAANSPRQHTAE